jgi:hypothetical protein
MEELANLIWIGCLIAYTGPPGFQKLWRELQPALQHYIYGFDATGDAMLSAARHLKQFAIYLDEYAVSGQVCFVLLSDVSMLCIFWNYFISVVMEAVCMYV